MAFDQVLEFTRIAERLVFQTIKHDIINRIYFPSGHIFLQTPFPQYVNTRTEVDKDIGENEENRYPTLAIYTIKEENINALGNIGGYQQDSYEASGTTKIWESSHYTCATVEFLVETLNKSDYMNYKNRLNIWFDCVKDGLLIQNDLLPESAGGISIKIMDSKEFTETEPMQSLFTAKIKYRIYKEYLAYLFKYYEIESVIEQNLTTINNEVDEVEEDSLFNLWSGNSLEVEKYPDDETELN